MRTLSLTVASEQRPPRSSLMALAAGVLRALAQRRAAHELARLDDHMLSDIGISRADISRVVKGVRY